MAPTNRPSTLGKVKTRDSVSPEVDSFYVSGSTPALAPLAAAESTLKLTTKVGFSEKCLDSLVDNGEEEVECQTPKSEEHKIPPVLCCPPAPLKRRSNLIKRKLSASHLERFYILSDSELHSLFGSDIAKISHQHVKRKILPKCLT
jgi:hypothetical protein